MEVLQSGFWALDPARTIRKYAAFADLPEKSDEAQGFVRLEDWANEGAPLTYAAGCDLFERLYRANETANGQWRVGGRIVDPSRLDCPILNILRSEEHTSELQSLMRISYAVFCLKKKTHITPTTITFRQAHRQPKGTN